MNICHCFVGLRYEDETLLGGFVSVGPGVILQPFSFLSESIGTDLIGIGLEWRNLFRGKSISKLLPF